MGELRQVGIGAARDARARIADLLGARGEAHPELAKALSSTVGLLYGAEVGDDAKVLEVLRGSMDALRALLAVNRWSEDPEVARALSHACALLHPAKSELTRALASGGNGGREPTAPFLLAPTRIKPSVPPPEDGERRDRARAELEVSVGVAGDNRFFTGTTGDLSSGGLFVATDEPLPVDTELVLSFVLPDGYRVRAEARVAWVRAPRYRPHELPAGMGLRFADVSARDLAAIRHLLEERPAFHYGD